MYVFKTFVNLLITMCGIFFFWGDDHQKYSEFMKLKPRGPNNTHIIMEDNMFFGFHRLMINDLTYNGNQPMIYNQNVLLCNGEIYNFKDIKSKFNITCKSESDCEVIVHLYDKLKTKSITHEEVVKKLCEELDGEFAFILYDKSLNRLIVARDRYGVRPLFFGHDSASGNFGFSSELKALDKMCNDVSQFLPSMYAIFNVADPGENLCDYYNNICEPYMTDNNDEEVILPLIKQTLEFAVQKRLISDVPICALLSGGLDSSLICGILTNMLGKGVLNTFSIGMEGSTDLKYARQVADYIGSIHHEVLITKEEMLAAIPEVIRVIESYDITTVRAATPNYLLAKYIKDNTQFKVVFTGEYSDEVAKGYMYFKKAPTPDELHDESNRLLEDICYFDSLRADRCISSQGLEARVPYSDHFYVKLIQSINPVLLMSHDKIEKYILRKAFVNTDTIPDEVLFRPKAAFSDAVSSYENSWHNIIQDHVNKLVTHKEFEKNAHLYKHCTPRTKEAYWYRKVFMENYKHEGMIPYFWLPRWCSDNFKDNMIDPSARTLDFCNE